MVSIVLTQAQVDSVVAQQAGAPAPTPTPAPTPAPAPPPAVIPSGDVVEVDFDWQNPVRQYARMGVNTVVIAKFTTGNKDSADNNLPRLAAAEWGSPPSGRYACLSDKPGDFVGAGQPDVIGGYTNPPAMGGIAASNSPSVPFAVGSGSGHGYYPRLKKNTTYYFNIKNLPNQTCESSGGDCTIFVELLLPGDVR